MLVLWVCLRRGYKMSHLQFLNVFLTERLTAVAMEISVVLEQKIGEYQVEISRSNEENKRLQRLLDLVFSSESKLHREDSQQLSLPVSEQVPPEQQHCQQDWSPSLEQEDPEPTQIKEEQEEFRTSQEEDQPQGLEPDTNDLLIPACVKSDYEQDPPLPSHLDQTLENRERDSQPTNTTEQIKTEPDGEDYSVSEPTRDSQLLSEAQVENIEERVDGMERPIPPPFSPDSQQPSLSVSKEEVPPEQQERSPSLGLDDPEPIKQEELWTNQEEQQLESDSSVSEPTSDSQLLSAVNPDCSAAPGENRKCVDGAVEMLILLFFPPDSQQLSLPVSEEEVPPEQQHCEQERTPSLGQEDPEPTQIKEEQEEFRTSQEEDQPQGLESEIRVSEPTSLCRVLESTSLCKILDSTSVANPDCSAAPSKKIEEYVDGPILPSYPPELPVSKEEVPSEQQERSPSLGLEDPEPKKQEELWTNQEEQRLESASRVSEPTSDSQLLSAVNPDCSAAQSENRKVHQSPSTSSEQDSSNVESNEASNFCTWSDENIPVTDRNSSDSSTCTKEESEARKPAKRKCHSSGVVNEPSDLSNLCDENNPGTEISPSDSNKDMNIQTDSGAHNPAKRICQRVQNVAVARRGSGEMVSCSRPKAPGSTPDYTHCMHCQGLYIQKSLWKHVRYCPLNPKAEEPKPGRKMRIQSAMAFQLCPQPDYVSTGLWKIVCGMNPSQVSFVVRNDKYILLMGEEMYNKLQPDDRRNKNIQQRMREVARLLITARTCTPLMCFEDLVIPSNLPHVITAVRAVAGYNEENKTYDRPTLAVQMGYSLMNIGSAVESCALKSGQHKVAESAGKFKSFKWNEVVLAGALSTLSEPKNKCAQPTRHTGAQPADPSHWRPASRPVTQEPGQPKPVAQAPGQPTPVAQAPGQPTPVAQAPGQPTPVAQAPGQPTPVAQAPGQPTPVAQEPGQPTPVTLAPSQTTRRTRAQPIRRTRTQPTHRTGTQPTQRHTVRLKWTIDEVAAVEKHMMSFIKSGRVPGKKDCLKCLQSESVALKSRSWSGIKFYVNNRLKRR